MAAEKLTPKIVDELRKLSSTLKAELQTLDESYWMGAYVRQITGNKERCIIVGFIRDHSMISVMQQLTDAINLRLGTAAAYCDQYDAFVGPCLTVPVTDHRFLPELHQSIDQLLDDLFKLP